MGASGMGTKLGDYVKKNYPDSKSDLFAVFIERCMELIAHHRFQAMITQHAWMFLGSYESLRRLVLANDIVNMVHLGARAFEDIGGEIVQTTSFVLRNSSIQDYKGTYFRLTDPITQKGKEALYLSGLNQYKKKQGSFKGVPGSPVAYWVSTEAMNCFIKENISDYGTTRNGMTTGNNDLFMRAWYEVGRNKTFFRATTREEAIDSGCKWFPYNKGGEYRKWYGNMKYVLNWENDGFELRRSSNSILRNQNYYFRDCLTWSLTNSNNFGARYRPAGSLFDVNGMSLFLNGNKPYILAVMNSCISNYFMRVINPTISNQAGNIDKIPIILDQKNKSYISQMSKNCVSLARKDWDSFETSWDFLIHPLLLSLTFTACRMS